jgi:hypothetical protein
MIMKTLYKDYTLNQFLACDGMVIPSNEVTLVMTKNTITKEVTCNVINTFERFSIIEVPYEFISTLDTGEYRYTIDNVERGLIVVL